MAAWRSAAAGHTGVLRLEYQDVAQLGPWSLTLRPSLPRAYDVTARLVSAGFWSSRRPLTLVLTVGNVDWEWAGTNPRIAGDEVTVTVHGMPTVVRWAAQQEG